jgi:outer membrane protein OmpA-like peptidoglycan-associated protein
MINFKKTGLLLLLALLVVAKSYAQSLKDAEFEFNKMSYLNAAEMFEQVLKGKLSDADKQAARLKLAYAYRQIHDSQNTERVYRELIGSGGTELSGDAAKAYLYYAQALASNGKYKDSQEAYAKYSKVVTADTRGAGFNKLYNNVEKLNKNANCYKVDYLSINTDKADFSPAYYKNGMVFNSSRTEGTGLKRVFCWDNSRFLDMYYLQDLSQLSISPAGLGGSSANSGAKVKRVGSVGSDEYTTATANDSRTIGTFGGTYINQGNSYNEEAQTKTERFSKTLNSKYHEGPMTFTSDGKKVIFTRNNFLNGKYKTSSDKINKLKLYTAEDRGGSWANIQEVPFNNNEYSTGHPSLSKDEKLMYFVSDMPGGFGGTDLYVVQYNGGSFGTPVNLGSEINTAGNEMFPFVDEKGNLYFSSDGHPGLGDLDVFFVELQDGSKVKSKIKNMGTPINSSKDDFGLIADGSRKLGYFSSNRKRGGSDDDIYRFTRDCEEKPECQELQVIVYDADSKMPLDNADVEVASAGGKSEMKKTDSNGSFKMCLEEDKEYTFKATREGYQVNTVGFSTKGEQNEQSTLDIPLQKLKDVAAIDSSANSSTSVTSTTTNPTTVDSGTSTYTDGSSTSSMNTGTAAPLPCKVTTLRGRVTANRNKSSIAGVVVTLRNECDGTTQQVVTGADGRYQFDICEGCDYQLEAAKENFGSRGNKIKKVGKNAPKYINANLSMFEENDVVQVDNIYYDYGKCNIREDATRELDKLATMMKRYKNMRIEIRSHTDSRATTDFNQKVSEGRSKAVVTYLKKRGVSGSRLEATGLGESALLNECGDGVECSEEQHSQNRRTEFKVLQLK